MEIRNRVIERRRMNVAELEANERNWKDHPPEQRQALEGILAEVGQMGELYAYHSERNGGALTLVDGHLRQGIGGEWDVAITDLTDAEADLMLLLYDPVAALAKAEDDKLKALMDEVETQDERVAELIRSLADEHDLLSEPEEDTPESEPAAEIKSRFAILIEFASEQEQAEHLERFTQEGLSCRSLIV